ASTRPSPATPLSLPDALPIFLLPQLLQLRRRSASLMPDGVHHIEGFEALLHRALTEPILLGGVPRAIAIVNGTVAAAMGLGLQRSEEHTSELQSRENLVCRLL